MIRKLSPHWQSIIYGMLGVVGFSLTLPATRLAVADLDPIFVGLGRAIIAAIMAGVALTITRALKPVGMQWLRLAGTALGVVIGFPLLSNLGHDHRPGCARCSRCWSVAFINCFLRCVLGRGTSYHPFLGINDSGECNHSHFFAIFGCRSFSYGGFTALGGGYCCRFWLCRRCSSFQGTWRMANDKLDAGHVGTCTVNSYY